MAHKAARKSRQHGEMLTETTLNCRKLLENSLETNRLCWMTEMARLFSIALTTVPLTGLARAKPVPALVFAGPSGAACISAAASFFRAAGLLSEACIPVR